MKSIRSLRRFASALILPLVAATAWAQDYTVTQVSGRWVDPPSDATDFGLLGDDVSKTWNSLSGFPAFPISYYGVNYTSGTISTNCTVSFTNTSAAYPGSGGPFASGNSYDGMIQVAHADDYGVSQGSTTAKIAIWTDGVAPNRRCIVAWLNWSMCCSFSGGNNMQVQFYEGSGRIVTAYTGSSWTTGYSYYVGIDEPGTGRFNRPPAPGFSSGGYTFTGSPTTDWQFDPRITSFTGTVLYDRYVVNSSGIGAAVEQNVPLQGLRVDLKDAGGSTVAYGFADATGFFNIEGRALVGTTIGSIAVTAQSIGAVVKPSAAGAITSHTIATGVSFANNLNLGTIVIGESADPGGAKRAAFNIARSIQTAAAWVQARSTAVIPQIDVYYDTNSSLPTSYTPATGAVPNLVPAVMRVSGASANPDGWDTPIIRQVYGRHILTAIAANPAAAIDRALDKVSDDPNAFAEGFGYYIHAALSLDRNFRDGVSSTSSTVIDLEDLPLTVSPGSNVASSVAMALFDLVDEANESWDTIDGRNVYLDQVLRTADYLTTPVTAATFYRAWGDLGYDGPTIARNFIHHNLIPDDADEPNDSASEPFPISQFGFVRKNRVLNLYDEDWYSFEMTVPTEELTASVVYDRTLAVTVLLELRSAAGVVIATGVPSGEFGPLVAKSGALPAGTYHVRFKHVSGVNIPNYTMQVFSQLAFQSDEFPPWTVGRPYNVPVAISGGVPPYELTVELPFVKPQGLVLDGPNARVGGTPTVAGLYGFVLSARDAAEPNNIASGPIEFLVNEQLRFSFQEFIAFPYRKQLSRAASYTGGTPPYTVQVTEGLLPNGITIAPGEIRFTGVPDIPGSYSFQLTGTDVAGSTANGRTTAVVCVTPGITPLAVGKSACGFHIDCVVGTSTSFAVKTSKKRAKRALSLKLLDQDGATEIPVSPKNGTGKAALSGFVAPKTGRYYFVVASATGDATELAGSVKLAPPKGGSGDGPPNFVVGKTFPVEIGALAGATLTFSAKPDKSGLVLKGAFMLDPAGTITPFAAGEVVEKNGAISVTKVLPTAGTWKFVVGAQPGPQGTFYYSFKLKQPKGVTFSID